MQFIYHTENSINPIFDEIERMFSYTSEKEHKQAKALIPTVIPDFDTSFRDLITLFNDFGGTDYQINYTREKFKKLPKVESEKNVILCFSGGKDSTATAMYFMDRGYEVILYHLKGINKTYKDEWETATKIANALKLPIVIEEVSLRGNQEWVEHPMKNMIIANQALQYGIKHNLTTKIAFGNFKLSSVYDENFGVCGSDCRETWKAYEKIIRRVLPGFNLITPFESMKDTWNYLLPNKEIAILPQSCIGPYRYRDHLNKVNTIKYHIKLPDNHCGSCWKCCMEYIVYADNDIYEYNEKYYEHCMKILQSTLKQETGQRYTLGETWLHYFFYTQDKSKYFSRK